MLSKILEMIINKDDPQFADVPHSLEGEVLLERTYDKDGNLTGYITAAVDTVLAMKDKTEDELRESGWIKYKKVIDAVWTEIGNSVD